MSGAGRAPGRPAPPPGAAFTPSGQRASCKPMPNFSIPFVTPGSATAAVPVTFVTAATWAQARERLDAKGRAFAAAAGFEPRPGRHLFLPGPDGGLAGVLFGLENPDDPGKDLLRPGPLPPLRPAGTYPVA